MILFYILISCLALFSYSVKATNDLEDDDEFFGSEPVQVEKVPVTKSSSPKKEFVASKDVDSDEFIEQKQEGNTQKKKVQPKQAVPPKVEQDFLSLLRKWWVESCAFVVFILYWINFWIGSAKNERIVTKWGSLYKQLLLDNFAKVGGDAPITKLSQSNFSIIATGRINCIGMHATFNLKNRQDLLSMIVGIFYPKRDRLTIDIAMENDMQMMVFALLPLRYERTLKDDDRFKDVREFAKKRKSTVPTNFTVFSDSNEILDKMVDSGLNDVLRPYEHLLEFIHITDQSTSSLKYKKMLRVEINLPEVDKMEELANVLLYSFSLIDVIAQSTLTESSQAKAKKARDVFIKMQKKDDEKEEAEKKAEAKRLKEEEALRNLSPQERKKEEERQRKKELKKKNKAQVKKHI